MRKMPVEFPSSTAAGSLDVARPADQALGISRFFIVQWIILLVAILVLGGVLARSLIEERKLIELVAQDRLSIGARSIAHTVEGRLASISTALFDLRNNLPHFRTDEDDGAHISIYLKALKNAVEGVRTLAVFDGQGTVTAASRPDPIGRNFRERDYFKDILNKPDAQTLYVSAPFTSVSNSYSLNLSRVQIDARGEVSGIVTATLEPDEFRPMLESLRYTPDVSVGLVHGSGKVFLYASTPEIATGTDVSAPNTFFSQHLQSGQEHSLIDGFSAALPNQRLAALHTINPAKLSMDVPLVVAVSQDLGILLAPWYSDVWKQSAVFALMAVVASLSLYFHQQRQRKNALLIFRHRADKARDLDRLELATKASGTGIWELDLNSQTLTWDDTLFAIFGKERTELSSPDKVWKESVLTEDMPAIDAAVQQAIDHGGSFEASFRIRRGDGEVRSIYAQGRAYANEAGQTIRVVGINRDITQQVRLEQGLRESKNQITCILDSLVQHIAVIDAVGTIVMINQSWRNFARNNGATERDMELVGLNYLDICSRAPAYEYATGALAALAGIQSVLNGTRQEFSMEYPCHSPTEQRWFIMHVSPLDGAFWGAVVAHENITARKLGEQAVRESEQRFSAFFEHAMVGMATTSLDKGWMLVNPALCAILGYPREVLITKTWAELTHPDDLAADIENFERLLNDSADEYAMEKRFIRPDGEIVHAFIAARAIRKPDRSIEFFAAIVEDISERIDAENALRSAQQLTQQFLDHLPGMAYVKDEHLRMRMANKAFQDLLGLDPATIIGKSNAELFPGEFGKRMDADDRQVLESGQKSFIEEDFQGRYFESNKFVIQGEAGRRLLGGITVEVTQRQKHFERQEALLKVSEMGGSLPEKEFLARSLEMVERLTVSQIGFIHFVNDDQETIELGTWTEGALKGCKASYEAHYPMDIAGVWADCARSQQIVVFNDYPGCSTKKGLPEGHAPLQRLISVPVIEEGKVRVILGVGNKPTDYDEYDCTTAQLIGNDIWRIIRRVRAEGALQQKLAELLALNTRLDETNNRLLQSEKLASLGQLAAGVAHEINNPIGYVSSNLHSLTGYIDDLLSITTAYAEVEASLDAKMPQIFEHVRHIKSDTDFDFIVSDVHHLLDESSEGLERVRKIIQDLKDFSRVGGSGWQRVNLHAGLESTLNIVWNEIKYKAEVDRNYGDLPEICCIPSQINQVFMNLLTNAAQSIQGHGRIVLRSGCEGKNVWVEVEDNGSGIDAENLERIFEPFYTTKPIGKGTGLGLSLSWGIIQRHHGNIEVRSSPGQGSTFRITLPIDQLEFVEATEPASEVQSSA